LAEKPLGLIETMLPVRRGDRCQVPAHAAAVRVKRKRDGSSALPRDSGRDYRRSAPRGTGHASPHPAGRNNRERRCRSALAWLRRSRIYDRCSRASQQRRERGLPGPSACHAIRPGFADGVSGPLTGLSRYRALHRSHACSCSGARHATSRCVCAAPGSGRAVDIVGCGGTQPS